MRRASSASSRTPQMRCDSTITAHGNAMPSASKNKKQAERRGNGALAGKPLAAIARNGCGKQSSVLNVSPRRNS